MGEASEDAPQSSKFEDSSVLTGRREAVIGGRPHPTPRDSMNRPTRPPADKAG